MGLLSGILGGGGGSSSQVTNTTSVAVEVQPQILNQIDFSQLGAPLDRLAAAIVGQGARASQATVAAAAIGAAASMPSPLDTDVKVLQGIAAAVGIASGAYILFFKKG